MTTEETSLPYPDDALPIGDPETLDENWLDDESEDEDESEDDDPDFDDEDEDCP